MYEISLNQDDLSLLNHYFEDIMEGVSEDYVRELLEDFADVFSANCGKLSGDASYMRLAELRFLLKNTRELCSIHLVRPL